MSNVGDALTGASGTGSSGVSDTTFADATLGDQIQGGTGDFTGGSTSPTDAGGGGFNSFSDIANALNTGTPVGSSPTAAQSVAMSPPAAATAAGGDPTGAASGTQSNTAPGSPTNQNQQQQTGGGQQTQNPNPDYASPSAVAQLKSLLKQLNTGKPPGPTGPVPQGGQTAPFALPTLAAEQTGAQSPQMPLPALAAGQTGGQSPQGRPPLEGGVANLPNVDPGETGAQSPGSFYGPPYQPTDPLGGSRTAGARIPPGAPSQPTGEAAGGGRDITVKPRAGAAQPQPAPEETPQTAETRVPLPTKKPGPEPVPQGPATSSILRDITGASTGQPTALADLAQAVRIIAPLIPLFAGLLGGGGGGRRGHRPGFQGMRGFRPFGAPGGFRGGGFGHLHGGRHPMAPGAWPYHHPQHGWHMHPFHPGGGWMPLNPMDAQALVGGQGGQPGQQGGPDPNRPPPETGGEQPGGADDSFTKSGYGSNPFIDALVAQESGGGQNIVSRSDKDSRGLTLAEGGDPNQISQGYFQIQNHPGGTWQTYARQAGVDLAHYPTPRSAPIDVQWNVASRIPIGQWGGATKAMLHQRFGNFDERMTLGQVATHFGAAGGRLAAQMPHKSATQPGWANPAWATAAGQLPLASQPMVAGQ